jgi:hypothetical protein
LQVENTMCGSIVAERPTSFRGWPEGLFAHEEAAFSCSLMTRENDYQLEQAAAQQAAATLGVEVQLLFAENDAIIQGTQVLKVIQSNPTLRPDAILCEPVGGPACRRWRGRRRREFRGRS